MSAWIEFHQALVTHHKLSALAGELGVKRPQAAGHLAFLWCWALDNAQTGDLAHISYRAIADAAGWAKKPEALIHALRMSGFLCSRRCSHGVIDDAVVQLHDWEDYGGRLTETRANLKAGNRTRQKTATAKRKDGITPRDHATGGNNITGLDNTTVDNSTQHNQHNHIDALVVTVDEAVHAVAPQPDEFLRCVRAYDNLMGAAASTPTIQHLVQEWLDEQEGTADLGSWFEDACRKAAAQNKKSLSYVLAILRREANEGRNTDTRKAAASELVNTGAGVMVSDHTTHMTEAELEASKRWDEDNAEELRRHRERRNG